MLAVWEKLSPNLMPLLQDDVQVLPLGTSGKSAASGLRSQLELARVGRRTPADVVHFLNAYVWGVPFLRMFSDRARILTIHDPFPHLGLRDPWLFPAISVHLATDDAIVVLGDTQKEILVSRFRLSPDRVTFIPHGEFSFFSRLQAVPESDGRTVLFFGRISRYKGLEFFLKAAIIVRARVPDVKFRIVGEGAWVRIASSSGGSRASSWRTDSSLPMMLTVGKARSCPFSIPGASPHCPTAHPASPRASWTSLGVARLLDASTKRCHNDPATRNPRKGR